MDKDKLLSIMEDLAMVNKAQNKVLFALEERVQKLELIIKLMNMEDKKNEL